MLRLAQVMSSPVLTAGPGEWVEDARERMRRSGVRHLLVVGGRSVIGVVSSHDLASARGADLARPRTLSDIMTRTPVLATTQTTLREAAQLLRGRPIGCLPVLERGSLVGIVTLSDILDLVVRGVAGSSVRRKRRPAEEKARRVRARRAARNGGSGR